MRRDTLASGTRAAHPPLRSAFFVIGMAFAVAGADAGQALTIPLPATRTAQVSEPLASDRLATGPYTGAPDDWTPVEGRLSRTAWRTSGSAATTLQMLDPLRRDLRNAGYEILFECDTDACGGFDFRYALTVISEPEMHVDLGDFRYLAARKGEGETSQSVALLVSRSAESGFVQVTEVGPFDPSAVTAAVSTKSPDPVETIAPDQPAVRSATGTVDLATAIEARGKVALDDLVFQTGAAALGAGSFRSLTELSAYLATHPDRIVTLVGHTDAEGPLDVNIAISRRRAQAVVDRLVADYGVSRSQLAAQGVGFLSPRASNLTAEGRTENRRVEAMLTSTR